MISCRISCGWFKTRKKSQAYSAVSRINDTAAIIHLGGRAGVQKSYKTLVFLSKKGAVMFFMVLQIITVTACSEPIQVRVKKQDVVEQWCKPLTLQPGQ